MWAGIGAYRNPVDSTLEQIRIARDLGAAGVVLSSYNFMVRGDSATPGVGYLRLVGDRAFATSSPGRR